MRLCVPGPPELRTRRSELPQNGTSLSARSSGRSLPCPDHHGLVSVVQVSGLDVLDLISSPQQAADVVHCEGSVWCEGSSCAELPCSGSARLLTSGGNDGLRAGSILEVRKWAGPGCSRRGSSSDLRMLRPGPAVACVPQPRAARREAGLNRRDLGRHYNGKTSEEAFLPGFGVPRCFPARGSVPLRPSLLVVRAATCLSKLPAARNAPAPSTRGRDCFVVQSAGFQITAKTLSSSCPAARPRLA